MTNSERWISIASARDRLDASSAASGQRGAGHRLAGWISDHRIRLRAAEVVTFARAPAPEARPAPAPPPGVDPVRKALMEGVRSTWPPKIVRSVDYLVEIDQALLEELSSPRAGGSLSNSEIVLDDGHIAPGARRCFYGLEVNESDLVRCMGIAGLAGPAAGGIISPDDAVAWIKLWLRKGPYRGINKAWDDFKVVPAHARCNREHFFKPAFEEAKAALAADD